MNFKRAFWSLREDWYICCECFWINRNTFGRVCIAPIWPFAVVLVSVRFLFELGSTKEIGEL